MMTVSKLVGNYPYKRKIWEGGGSMEEEDLWRGKFCEGGRSVKEKEGLWRRRICGGGRPVEEEDL